MTCKGGKQQDNIDNTCKEESNNNKHENILKQNKNIKRKLKQVFQSLLAPH